MTVLSVAEPGASRVLRGADLCLRLRLPRRRPRRLHGQARPRRRRHRRRRGPGRGAGPAAEAPFYEPGLPELLAEALATGRLPFTTDAAAAAGAEVHFVCVGTPQKQGENAADLTLRRRRRRGPAAAPERRRRGRRQVHRAGRHRGAAGRADRASGARRPTLLVEPGVPPRGPRGRGHPAPRTGFVYGVADGDAGAQAAALLDEVYAPPLADGHPAVVTDLATAELVKVAANSFLATKISFINAMAELCEATGADVDPARRRDRATTTGSAAGSSTPASASAAAACPRTSGRSWPGPASSAPTRR